MQEYAERLRALAAHWNNVELRIKQYEHLAGAANTAAINELRYSGRKIVDALAVSLSGGDPIAEITIAENYMVNADHDVTDGVCFVVLGHLSKVINKHGKDAIAAHYPNFWEVYPLVLKTQKIVEGSRDDRMNRKEEYGKLAKDFLPKLTELHAAIIQIPALYVPDATAELKTIQRRVNIITGITIAGSIFSTLAFFLGWIAWAYPLDYWTLIHHIF